MYGKAINDLFFWTKSEKLHIIADKHMFADKGKAKSVLKDMWLKADQLPPAYLNIQDSNEKRTQLKCCKFDNSERQVW